MTEPKKPAAAKPASINFRKVLLDPAPPFAANHFFWTRVNHEYLFEIGFHDLPTFRNAIDEATKKAAEGAVLEIDLEAYVTHRFTMGPDSLERFIASLEQLKKDFEAWHTKENG